MIDACLKLSKIHRRTAPNDQQPPLELGINRMSTGIALQQAHGYQSFELTELTSMTQSSGVCPVPSPRSLGHDNMAIQETQDNVANDDSLIAVDSEARGSPDIAEAEENQSAMPRMPIVPSAPNSQASTSFDLIRRRTALESENQSQPRQNQDRSPVLPYGISDWQVRIGETIHGRNFNATYTACDSYLRIGWILAIVAALRFGFGISITLALSGVWGQTASEVAVWLTLSFTALEILAFPWRVKHALEAEKGERNQAGRWPEHLAVTIAWLRSLEDNQSCPATVN